MRKSYVTTPENQAKRARIILLANEELKSNKEIAERLGINLHDITTWTKRWIERALYPINERLKDASRPGAPALESQQNNGVKSWH